MLSREYPSPRELRWPILMGLVVALLAHPFSLFGDQALDATHVASMKAGAALEAVRATEWPEAAFATTKSALVIATLGESAAGRQFAQTIADERLHGRRVEIRKVSYTRPTPDAARVSEEPTREFRRQIAGVHVLFIADSESALIVEILHDVGKAGVLTVSDIESFTQRGGMIGLNVVHDRVVPVANFDKIKEAQLNVDAFLQTDRASTIKAGMVLNFIRYTEWPAGRFASAESPIVLTVVGDGEIAAQIKQTVHSQRVHGRLVEVLQLRSPAAAPVGGAVAGEGIREFERQLRASHVVFICESERERMGAIVSSLEGAEVLTVSDAVSFAEQGGMLGLTIQRDRLAFEANLAVIQSTRLKVSSQLLRLARTVKTRGH